MREDGADGRSRWARSTFARTPTTSRAHTAAQIRYIVLVSLGSLLGGDHHHRVPAERHLGADPAAHRGRPGDHPRGRLLDSRERDSQDELGTLYRSFNQMLDALKSTHDQVANQAEQLAQEVGVRKRAEAELSAPRRRPRRATAPRASSWPT